MTEERGKKRHSRGPLSCAECRRLKLKCDRKTPCSSCLKRGCAAICPSGGLAPPAWTELNELCTLMEAVAPISRRIAHIMPKVCRLRSAAQSVYAAYTASAGSASRHTEHEQVWKDIKFLYGHSRLVDNTTSASTGNPGALPTSINASASQSDPACDPMTLVETSASSSSVNSSAAQPDFSDPASAPLDDLFAALNASFWPATDSMHAEDEQSSMPLSLDVFDTQPGLTLNALLDQSEPAVPETGAHQPERSTVFDFDAWVNVDDPMLPAPPLEMMPPSNLDLPWQLFMSGFGLDDAQLFYQDRDSDDLGAAGPGL
ncbi:hypothetical protein AURDEDRAFT_184122 [Auricularia subglabra TFB-10046 SS5]|nr:hypothetical protein AURDEDRAFT_184122 [Auricularia subglabra TFB-10046 SS5]